MKQASVCDCVAPNTQQWARNPEISGHGASTLPLLDDGTLMRFQFNSAPAGVTSVNHHQSGTKWPLLLHQQRRAALTRSRGRQILGM